MVAAFPSQLLLFLPMMYVVVVGEIVKVVPRDGGGCGEGNLGCGGGIGKSRGWIGEVGPGGGQGSRG